MFRFFRKKKPTDEANVPETVSETLPDSGPDPGPDNAVANARDNSSTAEEQGRDQVAPSGAALNNAPSTESTESTELKKPSESAAASEFTDDPTDDPTEKPTEELANAPTNEPRQSWMGRLKQGLSRTGRNIGGLFTGKTVDESLYEDLESALIMADASVAASETLIQALRKTVRQQRLDEPEAVRQALVDVLAAHLKPLEKPFDVGQTKPLVVMIAGVNGAGKTTSIGKLAFALRAKGASVLLAAGDTFRAAAREQLIEWGQRNDVAVIAQEGSDPAAVAFDAVAAGRARGTDVVMVDTAGRLPTQLNLMAELKKIRRVIEKAEPSAPHEVLLVVDGNTGQNALAQIKAFDEALGLTGLIVTKLDGTAKGGVLAALASGSQGCRPVPVYWVGVGEQLEDLQPFVATEFAQALIQ